MDLEFLLQVNSDRLGSRQIDELIGLARGLIADDKIDQPEGRISPATLPLCNPAPEIEFEERRFCVTGIIDVLISEERS